MDRRLLQHYNNELNFMYEMGEEFSHAYPKIASRLGIENQQCADPYVERLLEGFAFLTARVQLKIEEEFPKFCQQLISMVYPDYLAPLPAMTVVQFEPEPNDTSTADGFSLERGTVLLSGLGPDMQTNCRFRTAHEVKIYPLKVTGAEYLGSRATLARLGIKPDRRVSSAVRIKFEAQGGAGVGDLKIDSLPLYLGGSGHIPMWLYEHIMANACGLNVLVGQGEERKVFELPPENLRRKGYQADESLLNYRSRSFDGYRLLREYFACPERFQFIDLCGLDQVLPRCTGSEFEIIIQLNERVAELENVVDEGNFKLFCTPAVNIFPKRADRIQLNERDYEFHVVPDRSRPLDYEVYQVLEVVGYEARATDKQRFMPFYGLSSQQSEGENPAYYTVQRKPRVVSSRQKQYGSRSSYLGQEVFISLVDANEAPYSSELSQVGIKTLCTNRDLPLKMPLGQKGGDFTLEVNAPVEKIHCVSKPTKPGPSGSHGEPGEATMSGEYAWRVISHLTLNYLSLVDENPEEGASALRELLSLYSNYGTLADRQISGVLSVRARPVTRRLPIPGPISFGRGLEITITLEESAFESGGMYLFGSVLEEFFSKYVSVNNLTEVVVQSDSDIEICRWPVRMGTRPRA
ncbi:MAG: type VI secretion system baseplate subunit TssF [Xanthomonadales bacterium]|jgi:type VI secretion system protein ImpG|nr:type VI secretion system baseplate subunit TssF [Xanthomonadales bacterium]